MKLNANNVDVEALNDHIASMVTETFVLNRVGEAELDWFAELFQEPRFHRSAAMREAPSKDELKVLLCSESELVAWVASGHDSDEPVGICAWVGCGGLPFVIFEPITPTDIGADVLQELLEPVVHAFFEFTPGLELFVYVAKPVDDELHLMLVENGFDPMEHLPDINNEVEMGYLLARATYMAYFADTDDESRAP